MAMPVRSGETTGIAPAPTATPGSPPSGRGRAAILLADLQPFVADFDRLHGDLVVRRVEAGAAIFARPAVGEVEAHHLRSILVEKDDRAVGALDLALNAGEDPVPEDDVPGDAALQHQIL